VLHVEVDEDVLLLCGVEDGIDAGHDGFDGALEVDGVGLAAEGADLDGDVAARDFAEVVLLEEGLGLPVGDGFGEVVDEVEVLVEVFIGLGFGDAGFAEEVDGEGDVVVPELLEAGECATSGPCP
jgi:hypothetical protein